MISYAALCASLALFVRASFILCQIYFYRRRFVTRHSKPHSLQFQRDKPIPTIIVLGSGGHTSEMIQMIQNLNDTQNRNYYPLVHVLASSDESSEKQIKAIANSTKNERMLPDISFRIPRSREVGQSYLTSILTTCHSLFYSVYIVARIRPSLVLCNGPGTCIPIVLATFLFRILFACEGRIVFVESFCRVQR